MKHYILVCQWSTDDGANVKIMGVCHSDDEVQELYNKTIPDLRIDAEEWDLDVVCDDTRYFEAVGNEWHSSRFMTLYIVEV